MQLVTCLPPGCFSGEIDCNLRAEVPPYCAMYAGVHTEAACRQPVWPYQSLTAHTLACVSMHQQVMVSLHALLVLHTCSPKTGQVRLMYSTFSKMLVSVHMQMEPGPRRGHRSALHRQQLPQSAHKLAPQEGASTTPLRRLTLKRCAPQSLWCPHDLNPDPDPDSQSRPTSQSIWCPSGSEHTAECSITLSLWCNPEPGDCRRPPAHLLSTLM